MINEFTILGGLQVQKLDVSEITGQKQEEKLKTTSTV